MADAQERFTDATWRSLSAAGNDAFRRGDVHAARTLYVLAIEEGRRALARAAAGCEAAITAAPALYTIACHNLAELERQSGNLAASYELIASAFERLVDVACDATLPVALRERALANLQPAFAELVERSMSMPPDAHAPTVARAMEAWLRVRASTSRETPRVDPRRLAS